MSLPRRHKFSETDVKAWHFTSSPCRRALTVSSRWACTSPCAYSTCPTSPARAVSASRGGDGGGGLGGTPAAFPAAGAAGRGAGRVDHRAFADQAAHPPRAGGHHHHERPLHGQPHGHGHHQPQHRLRQRAVQDALLRLRARSHGQEDFRLNRQWGHSYLCIACDDPLFQDPPGHVHTRHGRQPEHGARLLHRRGAHEARGPLPRQRAGGALGRADRALQRLRRRQRLLGHAGLRPGGGHHRRDALRARRAGRRGG